MAWRTASLHMQSEGAPAVLERRSEWCDPRKSGPPGASYVAEGSRAEQRRREQSDRPGPEERGMRLPAEPFLFWHRDDDGKGVGMGACGAGRLPVYRGNDETAGCANVEISPRQPGWFKSVEGAARAAR